MAWLLPTAVLMAVFNDSNSNVVCCLGTKGANCPMKSSFSRRVFKPKNQENGSCLRKHLVPVLFVIIGIILIYSNSMRASFHFDDLQITERPNLHLNELSTESVKGTFYFTPHRNRIYRPIPCLTLGLNYYFGKENPFGYHIVNIVIHILCSIAVYSFLHVLLSIPGIRPTFAAKYRYEISVIATFLFAFHPIQVNAVTYIIQRMASMAALFYIVSVTGYLLFRIGTQSGVGKGRFKKYMGLSIAIISGMLSILSKENTAVLPFTILVIDYLFFYDLSEDTQKRWLRRFYGLTLGMILILVAYAGTIPLLTYIDVYGSRDFTLVERLLTEPRVVFFYLFLLMVPNVNLLNLNHDFFISKGIIEPPQTLFSIIGIVLMIVIGIVFIKRLNLISFVIWWFLGNLVIESSILPLELIYEHRTYLPGVMVLFLFSLLFVYVFFHVLKKEKWVILISFILIFYGNGTYIRNVIFKTPISLWQDIVEKSPNHARAHANLGKYYLDYGYYDKAKDELKIAHSIDPRMPEPLVNLGKIYLNEPGMVNEAISSFKKAQIHNPERVIGLMGLGDAYVKLKQYEKAEHFYSVVVRNLTFFGPAINNLGIVKIYLGKKKEAIDLFKKGIRLDPYYEGYYTNLAKLYSNNKRYEEAQEVLERYLKINGNSRKVKALLTQIQKKLRKNKTAEK